MPTYLSVVWTQAVGIQLGLSMVAGSILWVWVWGLGDLLQRLFGSKERNFVYSLVFGAWASVTLGTALGLAGQFTPSVLGFVSIALIVARNRMGLTLLPWPARRPDLRWVFATGAGFILALASTGTLSAWVDGNYLISAGHLARTGSYPLGALDGQFGMAVWVGAIGVVLPKHIQSPVNWAVGWVPWLGAGLWLAFESLLGVWDRKGLRISRLAILALILPVAMKMTEVRGSSVAIAWIAFAIALFWKKTTPNGLWLVAFALGNAWNFGQAPTLYALLWFVGVGIGVPSQSKRVARVLARTALLESPHLFISLFVLAREAGAIPQAFAASVTLFLVAALLEAYARSKFLLPTVYPHWLYWLVGSSLFGVALALNPPGAARFNWVFFNRPADFFLLNFWSFGIWGLAFGLAVILGARGALDTAWRSTVLGGFWASLGGQILCALSLRIGINPLGERALLWDVWKDGPLFWAAIPMLVSWAGLGLLAWPWMARQRLPRWVIPAIVAALCILPTHRLPPWAAGSVNEFIIRHLESWVDAPFRGQQIYPLPMYAFLGWNQTLVNPGERERNQTCDGCTIHDFWIFRRLWEVIDALLAIDIHAGDSIATAESVLGHEVFLNRRVHYQNSPDTIAPYYLRYLNDATLYEPYWRDRGRIRRISTGMAYSVDTDLIEVDFKKSEEVSLLVPKDGFYEVYLGGEQTPLSYELEWSDPNGVTRREHSATDPPGTLRLGKLLSGQRYLLRLLGGSGSASGVVYPQRDWDFEKGLIDGFESEGLGVLALSRYTGLLNTAWTVEEWKALLTQPDPQARSALLQKHHTRAIILDPWSRKRFPQAEALLLKDARLKMKRVAGHPIFEVLF